MTAQDLVRSHPEIGTVNGVVAKYVLDTYVSEGIAFSELVQYLQQYPAGTDNQWYNKSWSMWAPNGGPTVPAAVNTDLTFKGGGAPKWPTPPGASKPGIPTYVLTDEYDPPVKSKQGPGVVGAAGPVVKEVLQRTKDDDTLNGLLWSKQNGTTEKSTTSAAAPRPVRVAAADVAAPAAVMVAGSSAATGFAVKDVTAGYGLWYYDGDMGFDAPTKTLTLPVKNWYSRYLGAYVEFQKQDGTSIKRSDITATNPADPNKPFTWQDQLPFEAVRSFVEPSDTKNYLTWLSSGAAVFGAPVPFLTQRADLKFLWPDDATRAVLRFGGLGCAAGFSDWDSDVDIVGVLGTGLVNYGVGTVMLFVGVYVTNPIIKYFKDEWGIGFYAVAGTIGATGLVVGGAFHDTSFGKAILSKLAGFAASGAFGAIADIAITAYAKKAAERMAEAAGEMAAEMTAEEALEQVPAAGWALKIASIAADVAALAATTIECVLSPATYELDVLRTMDLTVTVTPDPKHGKDGFKPVWPLVSDHYVVRVTYPGSNGTAGGTTYTLAGPMPGQHDQPITVTFTGIPAGGKIDVTGNIYSSTDWLCGHWDSGWINAVPDGHQQAVDGRRDQGGARPAHPHHHLQPEADDRLLGGAEALLGRLHLLGRRRPDRRLRHGRRPVGGDRLSVRRQRQHDRRRRDDHRDQAAHQVDAHRPDVRRLLRHRGAAAARHRPLRAHAGDVPLRPRQRGDDAGGARRGVPGAGLPPAGRHGDHRGDPARRLVDRPPRRPTAVRAHGEGSGPGGEPVGHGSWR